MNRDARRTPEERHPDSARAVPGAGVAPDASRPFEDLSSEPPEVRDEPDPHELVRLGDDGNPYAEGDGADG